MIDKLTSKSRKEEEQPSSRENVQLPQMSEVAQIQPGVMPSEPGSGTEGLSFMSAISEEEGMGLMAPVSLETQARPDQVEQSDKLMQQQLAQEKYIRLRLRIEKGKLSVIGVRAVEGSLTVEKRLQGEVLYEVNSGQTLIAAGSLPTLGEVRGLPYPEGLPEQQMHHITELSIAEFTVRIPQQDISLASLPDLQITVYRAKGGAPGQELTAEPLRMQFGEQLRKVAQLQGIQLETLPKTVQGELQQALQ